MTHRLPVRLGRLQRALVDVIGDALDVDVVWDRQQQARSARGADFVSLDLIGDVSTSRGSQTPLAAPTSVIATLLAVEAGTRYGMVLNGVQYHHDAADEDKGDVRDAIIAALEAWQETVGDEPNQDGDEPVVATASGAAGLTLTPDHDGAIHGLEVFPRDAWSVEIPETTPVLLETTTVVLTVSVQCWSASRKLRTGADAMAHRIRAALRRDDVVSQLDRHGIGIGNRGPIVPLHAISGSEFESRTAFDVEFLMRATSTEPTEAVEGFGLSLTTSHPTITVPTEVPSP